VITQLYKNKYYKTYCKILVIVTEVAKILYYDNQITNSTNKIKTTWKIANLETCRKASNAAIESLNIDGRIISNQQHIAYVFNSYFLSIADKSNINDDDDDDDDDDNNNNDSHTKQI
jgi:hypothetical protein